MTRRIVFACPFPHDQIAGGIRHTYRHAELLADRGIEAMVFSPRGHPSWFRSEAPVVTDPGFRFRPDDIVVINEIVSEVSLNFLRLPCEKQMFCQNQFYSFGPFLGLKDHAELGISQVYGSSRSIRDFYRQVYGYTDIDIVPYAIDGTLFKPAAKRMQIAYIPRKLPFEASFIQAAFQKSHPRYRTLPWIAVENRSEEETAAIMAESAVFLALGHRDSFGLTAVEAMSAGCAVVGLHGGGGLEYARPDNGRWFHADQLLECTAALGAVVRGLEQNDPEILAVAAQGRQTAAGYNRDATLAALAAHFFPDGHVR
ncbi:MAG TPA: glycosyltransferase [Candidatus Sulfotelmatobacter sp.]|jgi:glycosyltransferase involved in cell wall biosynthesis|nr:glycosyltransferase [Candidatus Sulfotelmatobacter sp.]